MKVWVVTLKYITTHNQTQITMDHDFESHKNKIVYTENVLKNRVLIWTKKSILFNFSLYNREIESNFQLIKSFDGKIKLKNISSHLIFILIILNLRHIFKQNLRHLFKHQLTLKHMKQIINIFCSHSIFHYSFFLNKLLGIK